MKCFLARIVSCITLSAAFISLNVMAESKPNIVVILADDIGSGDISYYTNHFTPRKPVVDTHNIDAIAKQGVWFTDAHSATSLCSPTRYAVMTGKNNYRSYAPWGVWGSYRKNAISDNEPTLANVLKPAGYTTGFVGKWHLGGDFKFKDKNKIYRGTDEGLIENVDLINMVGGGPNDLGFDYSFMLPDGIQGPLYFVYENQTWFPLAENSKIIHVNKETAKDIRIISDKGDGMGDSEWDTAPIGDIISQKAADFILKQPNEKPFMLYYNSPMAHIPHIPPVEFDGKKVAGTTPSVHLDMVYELDLQVGRIVDALKAKGVYDNTLIVFTSDNGGLIHNKNTMKSGHKPSGKYRGSKNLPHEGGHRVPFIVSWPNAIKAGKGDKAQLQHEPVLVQDILATISAASGNTLDKQQAPDSKNILPLLVKGQGAYQAREYMMLQSGSMNEVMYREGDWKLIMKSDHKLTKFEPIALFNLATNLSEVEKHNKVNDAEFKEKVSTMRQNYLTIRQSGQPTAW